MEHSSRETYRSLARHFSALCGLPVTVADRQERSILFTEDSADNFYCRQCPNRCRLLSTMLYGCQEARRWQGKYTFYCPAGLVFSAVCIPETDLTVIAGPVVMGELQDTLMDLPETIDPEEIRILCICSSDRLRHIESLLEMAACGLRYRPNGAYDRNVITPDTYTGTETAVLHNSFPYMHQLQEDLRQAITELDKTKAREVLNQLLRYVYAPHPEQFSLIRSRAVQLVFLLSNIASTEGSSPKETELYRKVYIPRLQQSASLEEVDLALAEMLHLFVDYTFDFSEVKHSDTIHKVTEFIKSHYSGKLTLEQIAASVHLSPSHISGLFRKETGQTVSAYISYVRIEKSKQLLKNTQLSIAEIAAKCGFEEQSYFSRVFRKQTGLPPKAYRDSSRE